MQKGAKPQGLGEETEVNPDQKETALIHSIYLLYSIIVYIV